MIKNLNGINGTIAVQRNPLNCILKYESDAEYPNGQPARSEPAQSTTKTKKIQGAKKKKPPPARSFWMVLCNYAIPFRRSRVGSIARVSVGIDVGTVRWVVSFNPS